jgi:hypothetical protein
MRIVGIVASGIGGLVALVAVALGIRAIPDVKRYLHIRSM